MKATIMVITTWSERGNMAPLGEALPLGHCSPGDRNGVGGGRGEDGCGGAYHGHDVKGHEVQAAPVGSLRGDAFLEGAVSEFVGSTGHRLLGPPSPGSISPSPKTSDTQLFPGPPCDCGALR